MPHFINPDGTYLGAFKKAPKDSIQVPRAPDRPAELDVWGFRTGAWLQRRARYFVDADGKYLGGFAGSEPPDGAIEVETPPEDGRQRWDGQAWSASPGLETTSPA